MKVLIVISLLFFSVKSMAATQPIFQKSGGKVLIMLSGGLQDTESRKFYDLLTAPEVEMNGKLTKTVTFTNSLGEKSLQISCVFSKFSANNGRCTVTFYLVSGAAFDPSRKALEFIVPLQQDVVALAGEFNLTKGTEYQSEDGKFLIKREAADAAELKLSFHYN